MIASDHGTVLFLLLCVDFFSVDSSSLCVLIPILLFQSSSRMTAYR